MPVAERGILFENQRRATRVHPNRADIACFAGFVCVRPEVAAGKLPETVEQDLREAGWIESAYERPKARELLDVPVNIDSWDRFDALYAWNQRTVAGSKTRAATYLGAAVRSFFAEGGRQCVVIRVGDPRPAGAWPADAEASAAIAKLIPGYPFLLEASAVDRKMWSGMGHLAGLRDVSFLSLPDLPDLCADPPPPEQPVEVKVEEPEGWVEDVEEVTPPKLPSLVDRTAPRSDQPGYGRWSLALSFAIRYLARVRRDVQLVASLPRPLAAARISDLFHFLAGPNETGILSSGPDTLRNGIASAFLQLAYPWLKTRWSNDLPEGVEPAEGVLLGQLARNALTRGTFRSAVRVSPRSIVDLAPALARQERLSVENNAAFQDRVSLYGFTPEGIRLLSDQTAAADRNYRPAAVNRMIGVLVRAAQRAGEEAVFENSGEELWGEMEERLGGLLQRLYELGALRGDSPEDAWSVQCGHGTMTQNDIDNGRLIATVQFQAAHPVDRITVALAAGDGQAADGGA